jgi:hypothetical protein
VQEELEIERQFTFAQFDIVGLIAVIPGVDPLEEPPDRMGTVFFNSNNLILRLRESALLLCSAFEERSA